MKEMAVRVVGFIPPNIGMEGAFNTFRIGSFYTKNLKEGDEVFLYNEKQKMVFGKALVTSIDTGSLGEMCLIHAASNHLELHNDPVGAPERLFKTIQRIYGPHIAEPHKKTTVLYLQRL